MDLKAWILQGDLNYLLLLAHLIWLKPFIQFRFLQCKGGVFALTTPCFFHNSVVQSGAKWDKVSVCNFKSGNFSILKRNKRAKSCLTVFRN